jgi:lipid-binding SYLF domain-containing protein
MRIGTRFTGMMVSGLALAAVSLAGVPAEAGTAAEIEAKAAQALSQCYATLPACKALGAKSVGILIFPDVTKAAIGIGGSYGEGVLKAGGKTEAFYTTKSASLGLSIGAQERSEVIMFMTPAALAEFRNSSGWEVGGSASVAVIDQGKSGSVDTETFKDPVVGFIFGEKGLMADLSFEGAKIERFTP